MFIRSVRRHAVTAGIAKVAVYIASFSLLGQISWAGTVTVLPIQICKDDGSDCANSAKQLYLAETNKIWAQASITISFLPWATLNKTSAQTFASIAAENVFFDDTANNGISPSASVITMWFTKMLTGDDYGTVRAIGDRRVMIGDSTFTTSRIDTIAHEIGHVFGLTHGGFGAGGADNLMTGGGTRTVPGTIADITPDGLKLDKLTLAQIQQAQSSPFVVPEPSTMLLSLAGGLVVCVLRLRRRSA